MSEANNIEIGKRNIPKIISGKLQALRVNFKDEIPGEILHSHSEGNKIKARKGGWFTPVVTYLDLGLDQGEIEDPEIAETISAFTKYCTSADFHAKVRTSKEDIEWANRTIDLYLQHRKTR